MLIFILLAISLTCSSGHRTSHHSSGCVCPTNDSMASSLDVETVKDLRKEVGFLRVRLEELSSNMRKQTRSFQKMIEESCLKPPSNPSGPAPKNFPSSCAEATALKRESGVYNIQLDSMGEKPFLVVCNEDTQGGGWTVIQRRMDGSIDFFRDWNSYKEGFGNLQTEFFIGLDKLHALTTDNGPQELLIEMTDFDGVTKYAKYDNFVVGNESEDYALKELGAYSGDAKDSLTYHLGQKFSTKDKKNDIHTTSCALAFKGAWWYKNCHASNLNGLYLRGEYSKDKYAQGVVWREWHGHYYSLKDVKMMIRPKRA